jgi:hypothetical protein
LANYQTKKQHHFIFKANTYKKVQNDILPMVLIAYKVSNIKTGFRLNVIQNFKFSFRLRLADVFNFILNKLKRRSDIESDVSLFYRVLAVTQMTFKTRKNVVDRSSNQNSV